MIAKNNSIECYQKIYLIKPRDECIDDELKFSDTHYYIILLYSLIFLISSTLNITLVACFCNTKNIKKFKTSTGASLKLLLLHLSIADLIVTLITIPIEICWKYTVKWEAGEIGCKIIQFLRPFGIYLSSFILISLSIDRYYNLYYPLTSSINSKRRTKILIRLSWLMATLSCVPQAFVFVLKTHPRHQWYKQCVDFSFGDSSANRSLFFSYQIFVAIITFFLPLVVIFYTFSRIIYGILVKFDPMNNSNDSNKRYYSNGRNAIIRRARVRTIKLTIQVIIVFLICWTPYYAISIWHWIDPYKAPPQNISAYFFMFAVGSCIANPVVYGLESLFFAYKYALQSNNDALVLIVHWYLIQKGFQNLRNNGALTEILPFDWNENQQIYRFHYSKNGRGYELKCRAVDENIEIRLIRLSDERVAKIVVRTNDFVNAYTNTYERAYKDIYDLIEKFEREIEDLEITKQEEESQEPSIDPYSTRNKAQKVGIGSIKPQTEINPRDYGRSDIEPFEVVPEGSVTGEGGMIFDPFRSGRFTPPLPSDIPRGSIPPGARFDPTNPPDPDAPQPSRTRMEPNPDHLRAPQFGNEASGSSSGTGDGFSGFI